MPPRKKAAVAAVGSISNATPARRSLRSSSKEPATAALENPEKVLSRRRQRSVSRPTTSSSNASELPMIKEERPPSPAQPLSLSPEAETPEPQSPEIQSLELQSLEPQYPELPSSEPQKPSPSPELQISPTSPAPESIPATPAEPPVIIVIEDKLEIEPVEIVNRKFPTPINPVLREPSSVVAARAQKASSWLPSLPSFSFSLFGSRTAPQPSKHLSAEATRPQKRVRDSPEPSPSAAKPSSIQLTARNDSPSSPASPSPAEAQRPLKRARESRPEPMASSFPPIVTPRRKGLPPVTPRTAPARRLPGVVDRSIRSRRKQADNYKEVLNIQKEQKTGLRSMELTNNEKVFVEETVEKQKRFDVQDDKRQGKKRALPEHEEMNLSKDEEQSREPEIEPPAKRSRVSQSVPAPAPEPAHQATPSPPKPKAKVPESSTFPTIGYIAPGTYGITDAWYDEDDDDTTIMTVDHDSHTQQALVTTGDTPAPPAETSVVLSESSINVFSAPQAGTKRKYSEADLEDRVAELNVREADLAHREQDLQRREEELLRREEDYNKRVKLLPSSTDRANTSAVMNERMSKQKALAQKYAPKKPTGLREVNVMSSPKQQQQQLLQQEDKENIPLPWTQSIPSIFPFSIVPAMGIDVSDALVALDSVILPQLC